MELSHKQPSPVTVAGSALACPSAPPETPGSAVLGVVNGTPDNPCVTYLEELHPVTPDLLALSGSLAPTEIFRFAAPCQERACVHFDGVDCRLATRIASNLPAATATAASCPLRSTCRWFRQEGIDVCFRCPQIITYTRGPSEQLIEIAMPAKAPDPC
jgi:hypothetical protein